MSTLKKIFSIICICVLCVTAQAQVVIGVTRTGQVGTAGQNLEFVDQFGNIVAYPSLSPTGELLDAMRPSVVTNVTVTDVTKTSATTGGKVVAPGASDVTECGVCYGTSPYPTIMDAHLTATPDANGEYTVNLTGLQPNTTYYVRAYATNAIGTSYGTSMPFTTRGDATITITGNMESKTYNGSAQSVTGYTVTIPDGINITADQITYSGNAAATGTNVGTYTLTLSADDFSCTNANYDVNFTVTNGSLTITRADATVTITGNTDTKTYSGAVQSVTGYTVGIPDGVNIAATEIAYSGNAIAQGMVVGTWPMNLSVANFSCSNGNYNVTFQVTDGALTITKAQATITINDATKVYGEDDPDFSATVTGLQGNDQSNFFYTFSRQSGEDAGTYAITATPGDNPNYNVTVVPGTLTITKATATVTADNATKVYGAADPTFTATVTGVQSGDQLNYTLARATGENAGTYAINVTLGDNPNYEVTTTAGTFTIIKATATVTANNASKVYGATDPTFTATVTGVQSGDQLNYTLARVTGENAGTYAINVTLGDNPNYEVTTTAGTLTITKATATVTADNATKVYGAADPTFTATVTGVQSGDQLNYTLARVTGENAGTYAINVTLGDNPNYEVTTTAGTFTITKATATVTADAKTKVYGAPDPTFTATVTGVQSGDQLNYTLARVTGENAGTYAINVTLGDNPNYEVTTTAGTFTITKATATVTANNASKVYGATDPTFTATVTGVQSGDQLNYTLARATGENAGTYAINVTLGDNPNYEVTTTAGTFTITKATATVTITGNTGSKTYNGREQSVTGYTVGIPSGVNIQQSEISTTATATAKGTNVGTYTMGLTAAAFGTTNGNYDVTFQVTDGSITINRADATVTADNKTKVAGELDPSFTATVTGLQNGETASVLTYTFSRETGEGVGTYAIKPAGDAQQGNYNVTYVHGTLTITEPACPTMGTTSYTPSTVTASATSITFTTTLNNVASGVTISDATFTVVSDGVANQTLNATYSNGTITATLSGLDNYRGKLIKVTPKVIVSGCSNPGTVTGQAVEICVPYATVPTLTNGTTTGDGVSNKKVLFSNEGVTITANVTNYVSNQVESYGFLLSNDPSDIQSYSSERAVAGSSISNNSYSYKIGFDSCGRTTYYRAFIILKGCQDPIFSPVKSVVMWGPENFAITANPSTTVSSGTTVTLTANANMTVGSWTSDKVDLLNEYCNVSPQIPKNQTVASLETWIAMFRSAMASWCSSLIESTVESALGFSDFGQVSFEYRWDNGSSSKNRNVSPSSTTSYTCYGDFTYKGVTCTIKTTKQVEVQ